MNQNFPRLATINTISDVPTVVFERYAPALYQYAFRLCNSKMLADQLVMDVFAEFAALSRGGSYNEIRIRLDLYGIAYRILASNAHHGKYFMPAFSDTLQDADRTSANQDIEDEQFLKNIQQALVYDLTDDQRHVVLLRFMEGFSLKETALITGKKVGSVKVIQNRGFTALRRALKYSEGKTQTMAVLIRRIAYA